MSRQPPAVSVLLPVRNGLPYVVRAIDSILQQTWSDFELLVIDDGSVDATADYVRGLTDPRVRALSSGGGGLAAALNLGLDAARGRYVARQDADDWSAPARLATQLAFLAVHADIDVLATAVDFVDADGRPVENAWTRTVRSQWDRAVTAAQIAALMPLTCCLFHATIVAKRDVLRQGGYDQAMVPAEDYDLWLRLLPHHQFARLPDRLYTVRVHAASSSARRRDAQVERVIAAKLRFVRRQRHDLPHPATLWLPNDDRGAAIFRRIAPSEGFRIGTAAEPADVIAVTALSQVEQRARRLLAGGRYRQFGNLFVRERRGETRGTGRQTEAGAHPG